MAIYDIDGNSLLNVAYDLDGNRLASAYDLDGNNLITAPLVVRVLEYNVGNFANGEIVGYIGNDLSGYIAEWENFIESCNANICLFTESRKRIDNANTVTSESMYQQLYDNVLCYNPSEAWGAALLTDSAQTNQQSVIFTSQASSQSKYVGALINVNGIDIYVCSVHFIHGGASNLSVRVAQMNELLTAISSYENVILGGDLNTESLNELATLENAGFTFANGGSLGTFNTYSQTNPQFPLDNVGVKGRHLRLKSFTTLNATLSDHIPTMTEIYIV